MARWSESPAELVLSQAEIGVIVADRDGNVVFANEYIARLLRLEGNKGIQKKKIKKKEKKKEKILYNRKMSKIREREKRIKIVINKKI